MLKTKAKIVKNTRVAKNYHKILLSAAQIAKAAKPGQFLSIKVSDNYGPLLRRPFSVHRAAGSNIEVLYEVVGEGSRILSGRKPGEYLDIIGPLGNGFSIARAGRPILVAGGMGVAPLVFLAEKLTGSGALVLIGAKTKGHIPCEKEFINAGCEVKIATDDGSRGFKGYVTDLLKKTLSAADYRRSTIYACGPGPMLKGVSRVSEERNIPAQVSLEAHMACGIGACLGCVVWTKDGYKRVCKEGPVFEANQIIWG
ncbi:MAG: dihydroorotate dehydrogenase electron transfer subunit [Candidatus Omnitrophica bacterium]|nr:dihydroorotate dehydrogenase electron transfer subunit [Candidatus Omnitrophota bacterium]